MHHQAGLLLEMDLLHTWLSIWNGLAIGVLIVIINVNVRILDWFNAAKASEAQVKRKADKGKEEPKEVASFVRLSVAIAIIGSIARRSIALCATRIAFP